MTTGAATRLPTPAAVVGMSLLHQTLVSCLGATVPVLMPEFVRVAGFAEGLTGFYTLMQYVGAIGATAASAMLLARIGAATISLAAVVVGALGLLVFLPLGLAWFAFGALAVGLGYGPVTPASSQMIASVADRRRANFIFSLRQTGAPLGVLLAGLVVPALVALGGWRFALIALAAIATALAAATLPLVMRVDRALPRAAAIRGGLLGPIREALAQAPLRLLLATSMCFSAVQGTLNAFVPIIVASLAGVGLARAGLCAAAAQIGAIVGRLCWGVIADRVLAPRTTLGLAGALMAATALVLASITPGLDFAVVVAICIAFGFSAGGWGGVMLAETARLAPAGRIGPITSGVMLLNYSTVLLGAPIVGLVLELTGSFFAALATVAITAAVGSLLATVGPRR